LAELDLAYLGIRPSIRQPRGAGHDVRTEHWESQLIRGSAVVPGQVPLEIAFLAPCRIGSRISVLR
jgi:hypothetical protein